MKLDFAKVLGLAIGTTVIVANIDANKDGVETGKEKMQAAKAELLLLAKTFPEYAAKLGDDAKRERILQKTVDLLDEFVK